MTANKASIVVAITAVVGVLATSSATASSDHFPRERGGVLPCSLDGVNPVYHPEIFGNSDVARSYGFVRAPDGRWHVAPGCRR
jgi:hypothetical protein